MSEPADKYRRNAEEARKQAEKCVNQEDKEGWLDIAKAWQRLADETDGKS